MQIDVDGRRLGVRYPVEVPLLGDAAETLRALLGMVKPRDNRPWRDQVQAWVAGGGRSPLRVRSPRPSR